MKPYKKKKYKNKSQIVLTKEQNEFIETALLGNQYFSRCMCRKWKNDFNTETM